MFVLLSSTERCPTPPSSTACSVCTAQTNCRHCYRNIQGGNYCQPKLYTHTHTTCPTALSRGSRLVWMPCELLWMGVSRLDRSHSSFSNENEIETSIMDGIVVCRRWTALHFFGNRMEKSQNWNIFFGRFSELLFFLDEKGLSHCVVFHVRLRKKKICACFHDFACNTTQQSKNHINTNPISVMKI